jgi:hypothetical protein
MKRLIPLLFFLGGCVLLAIALSLFAALFASRGGDAGDAFAWKPLIDQVDNRVLTPRTLLLPLTENNSIDALNAALDQGHAENALALVAYDPSLADPARIGALLQIGSGSAGANDNRKAATSYQAAALLATLSPALSDPARLDVYQQAGAGLRQIGATNLARWVIDQAYLVAQYTPALRGNTRARRLEQIAQAYATLGVNNLADQARAKSIDAGGVAGEPAAPVDAPFVPAVGKLPVSPENDAAKKTRLAAVAQLIDDVGDLPKGNTNWSFDSTAQLGDALAAEDGARVKFYDNQLAQVKDPAAQIALLRDKINWLALKYRMARGAFGKDFPGWNPESVTISEMLSDTWGDLFRVYETQAASAKPDANQAREDVLRQELIAARWGWFTGIDERDLNDALAEVNQQLMKSPIPMLRLDVIARSGKSMYLLLPDELYGQGERALPR